MIYTVNCIQLYLYIFFNTDYRNQFEQNSILKRLNKSHRLTVIMWNVFSICGLTLLRKRLKEYCVRNSLTLNEPYNNRVGPRMWTSSYATSNSCRFPLFKLWHFPYPNLLVNVDLNQWNPQSSALYLHYVEHNCVNYCNWYPLDFCFYYGDW